MSAVAEGGTVVQVGWVASNGAPDSFRVERAVDGEPFQLVGITPGNAEGYRDYSLQPETTYRYRVLAVLAGAQSPPSAEAAVTTGGISFEEWEILRFTPTERTAGNTGWDDDQNGDGVPNGLVFALAASEGPLNHGTLLLPEIVGDNGTTKFRLTYRERRSMEAGVTVRILVSVRSFPMGYTGRGRLDAEEVRGGNRLDGVGTGSGH